MSERLGATEAEWDQLSLILGLTSDLLPVVADQNATISPQSALRSLGKVPSRYNSKGHAAGISQWTQKHATAAEVAAWRSNPNLGICVQTRHVRALDCDIDGNHVFAKDVYDKIHDTLAQALPCRRRADSSKFLLAFALAGEYPKRVIQTDHGAIEFLGNGQQFIACSTHPHGAKYEWENGLPDDIPVLTPEQFEKLWAILVEAFAADGTSSVAVPSTKAAVLAGAIQNDPVAQALYDLGVVKATGRDGGIHITCPFEDEHTTDGDVSSTTYFAANTGGFSRGTFHCLHSHCSGRSTGEFLAALGLPTGSDAGEFEVETPAAQDTPPGADSTQNRYAFQPWQDFINAKPPSFHVKGVLPEAALAVIYGAPSSGKTFLAMDIGFAVAQGIPWRGIKVKQGTVAYIAAEDAHGVRMRAKAYAEHHKVDAMPFYILGAAPNFRDFDDMTQVAKAVVALGDVSLIFVDTWARALAGGDENSAKDVGEAVGLCAKLYRATGATVVLIHHSGKDATKGARGSTALLGACDCEIEVSRCEDDREAQVTKLKNSADGQRYAFKLNIVPVGLDDDGEVVSSCVLEHVATQAKVDRKALEPRGANEKIMLRALDDLSIGGAVMTAEVIDAAVNHMPFDAGSGKRDQRRKSAVVALNALVERGILTVEGNEIQRKGEQ